MPVRPQVASGRPWRTMRIPRSCEENLRLRGGYCDIRDADIRPLIENPRPRITAVNRLVDAALVARTVCVPQHADIYGARVAGIDENPADLPRVFEANVRPCRASVLAAIHAIA